MIDIHLSQSGGRVSSLKLAAALTLHIVTLTGCGEEVSRAPEPRPVRAVIVQHHAEGEPVSLTGQIHAEDQTDLAFRIDGRMIERRVNVGDVLAAGEVIARLAAKGEMAILLVEQYLDFAREVADDLLVMARGQIVVAGAKGEVDEAVVRRYLTV